MISSCWRPVVRDMLCRHAGRILSSWLVTRACWLLIVYDKIPPCCLCKWSHHVDVQPSMIYVMPSCCRHPVLFVNDPDMLTSNCLWHNPTMLWSIPTCRLVCFRRHLDIHTTKLTRARRISSFVVFKAQCCCELLSSVSEYAVIWSGHW